MQLILSLQKLLSFREKFSAKPCAKLHGGGLEAWLVPPCKVGEGLVASSCCAAKMERRIVVLVGGNERVVSTISWSDTAEDVIRR